MTPIRPEQEPGSRDAAITSLGMTDHEIRHLRTLDPAGPSQPTATPDMTRMQEILAVEPVETHRTPIAMGSRRRTHRMRKATALIGSAAAIAAIAILAPGPKATTDNAYALWSQVGTMVTGTDAELLTYECQAALPDPNRPFADPNEPGMKVAQALKEGPVAFGSETRGAYSLTTISAGNLAVTCFSDQESVKSVLFHEEEPLPAKDAVTASRHRSLQGPPGATGPKDNSSDGIVSELQELSATDRTSPTLFVARVGTDLAKLTLSGPELPETQVTIIGNAGLAWWPGDLKAATTATITLKDGTSRQVPIDQIVPEDADYITAEYERVPAATP